jgi:hypothetical protein
VVRPANGPSRQAARAAGHTRSERTCCVHAESQTLTVMSAFVLEASSSGVQGQGVEQKGS